MIYSELLDVLLPEGYQYFFSDFFIGNIKCVEITITNGTNTIKEIANAEAGFEFLFKKVLTGLVSSGLLYCEEKHLQNAE